MKTKKHALSVLLFFTICSFNIQAQQIVQNVTGHPEQFRFEFQGLPISQQGAFYSHLWWFGDNQFSFMEKPQTTFPRMGTFNVFAAPTENYGTGGPPPKVVVSTPNNGAPINGRVLDPGTSLNIQHYRNAVPDDTLFLLVTYALPQQIGGTGTHTGSVELTADPATRIASNYIGLHPEFHPNGEVFDQIKRWRFTDLKAGQERTVLVPIAVLSPNQGVVSFNVSLNIDNHELPPMNNITQCALSIPVAESHDPNFMQETSRAATQCDFGGEPITYKVHFQNVGDTTTRFVQVKCHLDPKLNLSTISEIVLPKEYGNTQIDHEPTNDGYIAGAGPIYDYDEETHVLTFEFNDLVLRTTQDPMCKDLNLTRSSIEFTIKVLPNYRFGPAVVSHSTIVFDENDPIETNEVSTICTDPLSAANGGGFYTVTPTIQIAEPIKEEKTPFRKR
ncbi:MAG: hypothetical protein Crog4KO_05670 [Crocinitomicaceae bacterium]